jgi:hypothetical protein
MADAAEAIIRDPNGSAEDKRLGTELLRQQVALGYARQEQYQLWRQMQAVFSRSPRVPGQ